jgi:hypothetical protein
MQKINHFSELFMKTILIAALTFYSSVSFAVDLSKPFVGEYQVTERYCEAGDATCDKLVSVVLRFDSSTGNYLVEEHYSDNSIDEIELWTGAAGGQMASFSGNYNLSAFWSATLNDRVVGVDFYRSNVGAQIWYKFSQAPFGSGSKIVRRYKIN